MKRKQQPEGMALIEAIAATYAKARAQLAETVGGLNDELEAVKRRYLPALRTRVATARAVRAELQAAIEASPELFERPRTAIFHGVKVGYQKGKGKVTFDDPDKVVERIRKLWSEEQAALLIITEHKPNKETIAQLEVDELKRIGCRVEGTGDVVVIKDTAGEVDKLVAQLLKDEADEAAS